MDSDFGKDPESNDTIERTGDHPRSSSEPKDIPNKTEDRQCNTTELHGAGASISASPPSFISLEQILKAVEDVSKSEFDMALAHEIAVNQDFQLQKNIPKSGLEQKVSDICHKAFWNHLQSQLSTDPPDYTQAMVLLKEVKEILLWLLLPHNSRLKNEINEVLDIELIEQQAKRGVIDFLSYAQFIISTMSRLCAPARDLNIEDLRKLTDVIPLYKGILETLDLMKIDMVNFTISHMRPHIQQHSVEYEKKKFKEILESLEGLTPPVDGLKFTRLWLSKIYEEAVANSPDSKPATPVIIKKAYVKILVWKETDNFPETLHLDHERFITLGHSLSEMILSATVILVTYSNVGPAIQGITDFKENLKKHLKILLADTPKCSSEELKSKMENVGLQVAKEVNECLNSHGNSSLSKENEELLTSCIVKISDDDHHVRQLITKRLLEFLELSLNTRSSLKIPPGLSSLKEELSNFVGQFFSLVRHNQLVFGDYYDDILRSFFAHQ